MSTEGLMIASVGESLIDCINGQNHIGGCALNVALAAARLGGAVSYFGKISSDELGHMILERMIDDGVIFDPQLCNCEKPTLCSIANTDSDGKATYRFDYKDTATCDVTEVELSKSFENEGDIDIVFFGSISLLMEPGCDAIMPAIRSISTKPKLVFDPNVRPSLIKDGDSYRKMVFSLAGECDLVKASDDDVSYLFPGLEADEAQSSLAKLCKCNLVVTKGSEGSSWFVRGRRFDCPTPKVDKVVDTVGCGDTFAAGLLVYMQSHELIERLGSLDRQEIESALMFASKAAALNCLKAGCNPPFISEMI